MLLKKNVKSEWFNNIVINKDYTVFLSSDGFLNTYEFSKKLCTEKLPFGIAEVIENSINKSQNTSSEDLIPSYNKQNEELKCDENSEFNLKNILAKDVSEVALKCTMFVSQHEGVSFFHQWQRQRRMWWRKFSPNPGRYHLSDIRTCTDSNTQNVEVFIKYPWGNQHLESLVLFENHSIPEISHNQFKEGRKLVQAKTIVSQIDLNTLFLNTIFDAYDDSVYKNISRTLLRFHRKVAPYKISFTISATTAPLVSELSDLALYLTRQLRTNQISTLLLPSSSKLPQDTQWRHYDELGIPYNVLLNESTLKDGILFLRSRDTTLKEQVHVSQLVHYVEMLFKNY